MAGKAAFQKRGPARPGAAARRQHGIELADGEGRKGTREARRRPGGKGELRTVAERTGTGPRGGAEAQGQPMLGLDDFRRAVQFQPLGMAAEIGHRHEQVERLGVGDQRRAGRRRRHGVERVEQQMAEPLAAEGRLEPTRAHEQRQLGPDFRPGAGIDARHRLAAPVGEQRQRHRPELRIAGRPRFRVDQPLDIGGVEPERGQRIERLAGGDRLGKEDAVDAAGAGPGDDVRKDRQPQPGMRLDQGQERLVDGFGARRVPPVLMGAAGARQLPDLLGDPMHVDGKADPAVTDQGKPQFLFPHGRRLAEPGAAVEPQSGRRSAQIGR